MPAGTMTKAQAKKQAEAELAKRGVTKPKHNPKKTEETAPEDGGKVDAAAMANKQVRARRTATPKTTTPKPTTEPPKAPKPETAQSFLTVERIAQINAAIVAVKNAPKASLIRKEKNGQGVTTVFVQCQCGQVCKFTETVWVRRKTLPCERCKRKIDFLTLTITGDRKD